MSMTLGSTKQKRRDIGRDNYGGNRDIALNHHQGDDTAGVVEITDASTGLENVNAGFIIPKEVEPPDRDSPEAIWKGRARIAQVPIHQHEGEAEGVVGSEHKTELTTESPAKPTKPGGVNFISMLLRTAATISEVIEEAYRSLSSRPRSGRYRNRSRNACLKPQVRVVVPGRVWYPATGSSGVIGNA